MDIEQPASGRSGLGQVRLEDAVKIARRQLRVIVLCTLVATGFALGASLPQREQYSATAGLLFRDPGLDQTLFGSIAARPSTDPQRDAATNLKLVSLDVVFARTARALDGGLTASKLKHKLAVVQEGQSDVVSVTATDGDPTFAARIANTFCKQFIAFRRDADRAKLSEAERLVQRQLAALPAEQRSSRTGQTLARRAEQLRVLASLQTGKAELVQPAIVPGSPSSPRLMRNTVLGFVLGLVLGVASAFLLHRLDRRVQTVEDLEDTAGYPVLGQIPHTKALAKPLLAELPSGDNDSFRMLLTRLLYSNVDRDIRLVLVTSAEPREGKSTVAHHLALAATQPGARVLLLEADMRRPVLAQAAGLSGRVGLAEVLTERVGLDDAIQTSTNLTNHSGGERLDVLIAGTPPPNASQLLDSWAMTALLEDVSQRYDLVVVDTAPVGVLPDAIPLLSRVDGVIIVGRVGLTTRHSLTRLRDELERLRAPLLGIVANAVPQLRYHYYSASGHDARRQATKPALAVRSTEQPAPAASASARRVARARASSRRRRARKRS